MIKIKRIELIVCDGERIDPKSLHVKTRKREIILIRHSVMWLAVNISKLSFSAVGRYYGQSHANVISAVKNIDNLIYTDTQIKEFVNKYKKRIEVFGIVFKRIDSLSVFLGPLTNQIGSLKRQLQDAESIYNTLKADIIIIQQIEDKL
jgi:hypothetical protein